MDTNKGKPINTSVPSMSIRFNATSEEIEELFDCEEESNENATETEKEKVGELESSPRRSILPLLGKRSTSVDVTAQDASPPSDPWRFLSDIKGKITKSVEVKLTEYKAKNQDGDGSPKVTKPVKDSKDNSSRSDSEEVSESSISRTCGIVSTTEGVEMSSDDDDTPSLSEEQDRVARETAGDGQNMQKSQKSANSGIKQRYRVTNGKTLKQKEGTVDLEFLEAVQKLNEDDAEVESGVDVLADLNVSNFKLDDDDVLNISQVTGEEIRRKSMDGDECQTVFSPIGFVDLRPVPKQLSWIDYLKSYQSVFICILSIFLYYHIPLSSYFSGFLAGVLLTFTISLLYFKLNYEGSKISTSPVQIVKVPAIREHQPLKKCEGWMNEFPEEYDAHSYHIMQTQSVYLRLQGNFLRISNTRHKISKRAMWNETEHKVTFSSHRIYNLLDAKVSLLPEGLAKIRHWSKKYPICITLNKDQLNVEPKEITDEDVEKKRIEVNGKSIKYTEDAEQKKVINNTEETEELTDVDESEDEVKAELEEEDRENNLDWCNLNSDMKQKNPDQTHIYLFGRTDREKEDWYRRLITATHPNADECNMSSLEEEYITYMKLHKEKVENTKDESEQPPSVDSPDLKNLWINSLMTRVMFDCIREESVIQRMKERVQRKLASIRLPYFIQEVNCEELNLGTTSPIITGAKPPHLNDRGLWLDLDINYQGLIIVILQTKVNLLKLKQPQSAEEKSGEGKSAIFHSDIDDSAESSTDDDNSKITGASVSDAKSPVGNRSKKIMKMVDRIAESKIFQVATENKYIKKAMQDISNTDLRLKVEFKKCIGTLVLNIPPPPTDRIWLGFRTPPDLLISACPIVGERNINFLRVTSWIEKIIYKEFQKIFVIPNMEDLPIPVMSPKLPE